MTIFAVGVRELAGGHVVGVVAGGDGRVENAARGTGDAVGVAVGTLDEVGAVCGMRVNTVRLVLTEVVHVWKYREETGLFAV